MDTTRLRALAEILRGAWPSAAIVDLARSITEIDRYQASQGIERAAELVAAAARELGAPDVAIHRFSEGARWWSFRAPRSWTPIEAMSSVTGGGQPMVLRYPEQPCSLATFSAPVEGVRAPLVDVHAKSAPLEGAVALLSGAPSSLYGAHQDLVAAGALGFFTDWFGARARGIDPGARGRIELPAGTPLFGFSVTEREMAELRQAARSGARAEVRVKIDRSASMPVVAATFPGDRDGEVWLLSHLCHPRPGAGDNAAAVAALAGIAGLMSQATASRHTVRLIWMPEMCGTAAYLHHHLVEERQAPPRAVLNLDMIGTGESAGPLLLEAPPIHLSASWLPELFEACLEAAGEGPPDWRQVPFAGLSDHMLFADRSIAVPAVCLGRPDDPLKHSSADRFERIDPLEIRRCAIAAMLAALSVEDRPLRSEAPRETDHTPLHRAWPGPFNLFGALEQARESDRRWFWDEFAQDRRVYSACLSLALEIDDRSSRESIIERTGMRHAIAEVKADRFLELLAGAGWVQ